jgi:predicted nucleic acid-binding protein
MILADSSVWIDHLNRADNQVHALLEAGTLVVHPFIIGEIALGSLRNRRLVDRLFEVRSVAVAEADEVLHFIESERLFGSGIGYVDAHLLASVRLAPDLTLWTRDRRLSTVATRLGIAYNERR